MIFNHGVTFGRFSPFKKGHVNGINDMLGFCKKLTVGIIDSDTPKTHVPDWLKEFSDMADYKNSNTHTVFSLEERIELAQLSLQDFIRKGKVEVTPISRPEYSVDEFNRRFSPEKHIVMFSGVDDNDFDILRNKIMGRILGRTIKLIKPTDEVIHNTDLLSAIKRGEKTWKEIIPKSAYGKFTVYAQQKGLL